MHGGSEGNPGDKDWGRKSLRHLVGRGQEVMYFLPTLPRVLCIYHNARMLDCLEVVKCLVCFTYM